MLCNCGISKLCFLIVAFPGYLLVYFSYAGFVLSLFVPHLFFWYLWGGEGGGGLCFVNVAFPRYAL